MLFMRKKNNTYQIMETGIRIKGCGWMLVSPEIKDKLMPLLPYAKLTLDGDVIIDAEDNPEARAAAQAEPPLDELTLTQLAIAELAEAQEAAQTVTELVLAELAELLVGGE